MKKYIAAFLLALCTFANAQAPVVVNPNPVTTGNYSSTIAVTNTFQSILALSATSSNPKRSGCSVQNNGTNTMWVFFGAIAGATKAKSIVLTGGQSAACNIGGGTVLQDQVSITGTSGDAFYAAQQ